VNERDHLKDENADRALMLK